MQSANMLLELYGNACDMFIRPPKAEYDMESLGPTEFTIGLRDIIREDIQIKNNRKLILECSHYYPKHFQKQTKAPPPELDSISSFSVKQLKEICNKHSIDISNCIERTEIVAKILETFDNQNEETKQGNAAPPIPCIIYLHGNCGCRQDTIDTLELLLLYGLSVFSLDLSGSGKSEGEYISLGYYEQDDVGAVLEYLKKCSFISHVGLWGRSMGAATSLLCTSRFKDEISLLILDSPFTDLYSLAGEVVEQMDIGIPAWVINSGFSLVMQMVRRSVSQKARFDLYAVEPIKCVDQCTIPAFFIHGESDDFVSPKHSLSLFEKYGDKRKEIMLVPGDHNTPRPACYDYISAFLFRYFVPPATRDALGSPLRLFGPKESAIHKNLELFYVKQIRGVDSNSKWPFNMILGVGDDCIQLFTPYIMECTNLFHYQQMVHVYIKDDNLIIFTIPGHVDKDIGVGNHYSGNLIFYTEDAGAVYTAISNRTKNKHT